MCPDWVYSSFQLWFLATYWTYQKTFNTFKYVRLPIVDGDENTCGRIDTYDFSDEKSSPAQVMKTPIILRGLSAKFRKPFTVVVKGHNLACQEPVDTSLHSYAPVRVFVGQDVTCTTCGLVGSALGQCQLVEDRPAYCSFRCERLLQSHILYIVFNAWYVSQANAEVCEIIQSD